MKMKHRVVAAIDFGTHGSGFAWATVSHENNDLFDRKVTHFFQWKDQRTLYAKNRSALLIGPGGELVAWGHEALRRRNSAGGAAYKLHSGFKMDLQTNLGEGLRADDALSARTGSEAFRLVVMCLREVFRAACAEIVQGLYHEEDIRWCITVPAIWDPFTTELMYQAAVAAGLPDDPDRLYLAREPAAAALYCVAKGMERLRTAGTRFMVVDAGGGTVDISSYLVQSRGQLSELAAPSGTKKGSEYLNSAFIGRELSRALGADRMTWLKHQHRLELVAVMDAFEQEKLSFAIDSQDGLRVDLGAQLYQVLMERWNEDKRGPMPQPVLVLDQQRVAGLFEDLLSEILADIDAHLEAMRAASGERGGELVMLVGGFAQSPYLRTRVRDHLALYEAEVIVPPRPELAVLSGAVHFAYDPDVFLTWRAPLTYGVRYSEPFREGVDPESSRRPGNDGTSWCGERFRIFVQVGQSVSANEPITRKYAPVNETSKEFTVQLLTTDRRDVEFASDMGVAEAGRLVVDLSRSVGRPREDREVEVTMQFGQSRIVATAHNIYTGDVTSVPIKWRPTW